MSKVNKVNPGQYSLGGRLTPDDAARERVKQRHVTHEPAAPRSAAKTTLPTRSPTTREKGAAAPAEVPIRSRTKAAGRSRG
jgi:hypothetical protein